MKAQRRVKKEADNADLMGLQRDVLKLGLSNEAPERMGEEVASAESDRRSTFPLKLSEIFFYSVFIFLEVCKKQFSSSSQS